MAKVYVADATVERIFESRHGWGVRVFETRKSREGESWKDRFTLWFKDRPEVEEGWVISASGYLSSKVREYEAGGEVRHVVDSSLNGAVVLSTVAENSPSSEPWQVDDAWQQIGERF